MRVHFSYSMYSIEQTGYSVWDSSEPQTSNPFLADQTRQQFKLSLRLGPGTPNRVIQDSDGT